jgi:hypothetical protein
MLAVGDDFAVVGETDSEDGTLDCLRTGENEALVAALVEDYVSGLDLAHRGPARGRWDRRIDSERFASAPPDAEHGVLMAILELADRPLLEGGEGKSQLVACKSGDVTHMLSPPQQET